MADEKTPPQPVLIDLGKHKRKRVRRLKKGRGPLVDRIDRVVSELRSEGAISDDAQTVVIVVREKRRRKRMKFPRF